MSFYWSPQVTSPSLTSPLGSRAVLLLLAFQGMECPARDSNAPKGRSPVYCVSWNPGSGDLAMATGVGSRQQGSGPGLCVPHSAGGSLLPAYQPQPSCLQLVHSKIVFKLNVYGGRSLICAAGWALAPTHTLVSHGPATIPAKFLWAV
jgi:hypothetical protein